MLTRAIKLASIFSIILALSLITPLHADEFYPAKVKDISDRHYEPAIIALLDGAKESIVMSMYSISLGTKENNPVKLLLNDLLEARERGVSVTIYLNTRFKKREKNTRIIETPEMKKLEDAGCVFHLIKSHQRLHDKLIIVDARYVVEASANWSISALKDNYESATLIDSKGLARIKLARLESFMQPYGAVPEDPPDWELYTKKLPKEFSIPKALIMEKKYLPAMMKRNAVFSANLYFRLLAYSQSIGKNDFFLDMSAMATSMGMSKSRPREILRRQVMSNLRDLKKTYKLLNVRFVTNKDAWVELADIPGDTLTIPTSIILDNNNSLRAKYYLIAQELFKLQGEDINTMPTRKLEKLLPVSDTLLDRARRDLKEK